MLKQFARPLSVAFVLILSIILCFDEASAQRRRKRSRRVTNPVVTRPVVEPQTFPTTTDPRIISTAEEQAQESPDITGQVQQQPAGRRTNRRRASDTGDEADSMRRSVNDLSSQVTKLSDKMTQMERQQRTLVDLERLSRAEQRAEALRTQLRDVQDKEGSLTARMEQIDYELKPENIERSVAPNGSTRPEEAREARRRALESEKTRVRTQLDLLATSRQRLETAIVNADLEVDKLRKRIEETDDPQQPRTDATDTTTTEDTEGASTTTPSTTPPATNSSTPPL